MARTIPVIPMAVVATQVTAIDEDAGVEAFRGAVLLALAQVRFWRCRASD